MVGRFVVMLGCVLIAVGTVAPVSAANPPRPGTTESGLNESEEATLWSNLPADYWERDDDRTTVHEVASETDLTFTEPPSTASRWTEYAHGTYQPGGTDRSVYPTTASPKSSSYIKDAHATVFAVSPSTRTYLGPDETRRYVAPAGKLYGTVDYRIEVPPSTQRGNWSYSWTLRDHEIDDVRLYADGTQLAEMDGRHRPVFEYELTDGVESLRVEAEIEATLTETARPPPDSNRSTHVRRHRDSITVSDSIDVDVYRLDATARSATYPDGQREFAITQSIPWQRYSLEDTERASVRGVFRFFTARDTRWDRLTESTARETREYESDVLPVTVHAYPTTVRPQAKPEFGGPTIVRTWGESSRSPANSLPEHVAVDVVDAEYTDPYGIAIRTESGDSETVIAHGLVYGTETEPLRIGSESREIRTSNLSASITDRSADGITVQLTLEDESTGDPIALDGTERSTPLASDGESGYIVIDDTRVRTNANGRADVFLSEPGSYTARYEPAPWLDVSPGYTGDTATVRWHPLTTISAWLDLAVRFGTILLSFVVVLYAGRHLGRFISGARR